MAVPMLDLRAQYARIKDEVDAAVAEVFESQRFIGGPKVDALEAVVASSVGLPHSAGLPHAVGVASGTDALLLTLKAMGVGPGDEVITTPFTFFATAGAIHNAGAVPVFVDISPATFNIVPDQIEARISPRTRAIMPVHLFGQCADMAPIMELAARHNLTVIEDAAQSISAQYHGRNACGLGHVGALSFFPSKNLGGVGDGGMVVTPDGELAQRVRLLRNHGAENTYVHSMVGTNSRLDALQAAVLLVKLKYLDTWTEERRANAQYYGERLAGFDGLVTPVEVAGCRHVYNQYVVCIRARERARALLQAKGIGCAVYYPLPLHRQECFRYLDYAEDAFPAANKAAEEVLALPIYPEMTRAQQDEVVEAIGEHLAN